MVIKRVYKQIAYNFRLDTTIGECFLANRKVILFGFKSTMLDRVIRTILAIVIRKLIY